MTRVTPSLVQVILGVAVAEIAVQYSQITDSSTMLWTPALFWKRISGRVVTVNWLFTAKDWEGGREVRELSPVAYLHPDTPGKICDCPGKFMQKTKVKEQIEYLCSCQFSTIVLLLLLLL